MRLTLELKRQIAGQVEAGMSFAGASRLAGVYPPVAQQWLARAMSAWDKEEPDETDLLYIDFATEVLQALGKFEEEQVTALLADAEGDWRARAWLLERRFGKDWAARQESTARVVHEFEGAMEVHHSGQVESKADWTTPEQIRAVYEIYEELGARQLALEGSVPETVDLQDPDPPPTPPSPEPAASAGEGAVP